MAKLTTKQARDMARKRKRCGPLPLRKYTCKCGAKLSAAEVRKHRCATESRSGQLRLAATPVEPESVGRTGNRET